MVRATASAMLIAAFLSAGAAVATAAEIEVCEHKNYAGRCVRLLHGVNNLADWGMTNLISSFRIRSGTWRLCTGANLEGACQDFTRSVPDLAGSRLQDNVSSLRPVRSGTGGSGTAIVVYTAPFYRGRSLVFSDDAMDLRQVGLNDRIASVRVLGGLWQICTDINFVGCRSVTQDIPDLGAIGWGSRVSSIREGQRWWGEGAGRPGYPPGRSGGGEGRRGYESDVPTLTLFQEPNYKGRSYLSQKEIRNLADVGFNDMAASIRVSGGRWQVCTDSNFRGQCLTLDRNNHELAPEFLRQISSIRRLNEGGGDAGGYETRVPTLTLFDDENFRGRSYATQREVRNLADVGFNDMAVSVRIDGGRWEVCTDKNFQGQCVILDRSNSQLATNFARQISSIRPR